MSGPATAPFRTSSRNPTSTHASTPASRAVVTPDSSARLAEARSAICVCASIKPGNRYLPFRSITRIPEGGAAVPIDSITPLRRTTVVPVDICPLRTFIALALVNASGSLLGGACRPCDHALSANPNTTVHTRLAPMKLRRILLAPLKTAILAAITIRTRVVAMNEWYTDNPGRVQRPPMSLETDRNTAAPCYNRCLGSETASGNSFQRLAGALNLRLLHLP